MSKYEDNQAIIDKTDEAIIQYLQQDGRSSYTEISKKLGMTVGTIRNRVQRMKQEGILKIAGIVDPFKTGMPTVTMFGLKVQLSKMEDVIEALTAIPEIRFVAAATGTFDLYAESITSSNAELYRIIREEISQIEGIVSIDSSMILKIHKQSYTWGVKSSQS